MRFYETASMEQLHDLIKEVKFLPFFKNNIEGFSIEECTPPYLWFSDELPGPWEWKGPLIRTGDVVYGKFFNNKAGYISLDAFPEFANYRRNGYDFDAFYDDGFAPLKDKKLYDIISENGAIMTKKLKEIGNYRKGGNKGFDSIITKLQMQTHVCIADFQKARTKDGREYGWGIASYAAPEYLYGENLMEEAYRHEPAESREIVIDCLHKLMPDVRQNLLLRLISL